MDGSTVLRALILCEVLAELHETGAEQLESWDATAAYAATLIGTLPATRVRTMSIDAPLEKKVCLDTLAVAVSSYAGVIP
jgi:hypothetical protein